MKENIIKVLKVLYKVLPYVIAALGGTAAAVSITGCKVGSLVSLSTPMV